MIYLDSAATTFQKPPAVRQAMLQAMDGMTTPGRGGYPAAQAAAQAAFRCRSEIAELFHVPSPEQVVFTSNATHGLNIAIKTLVHPGGRVVISGYEHNAVTRPLYALKARTLVADTPLFRPELSLAAFEQAITPDTEAVICSQVSNVFGFIQPVEEIAALCRKRGVPLIVDASQGAGVVPLDFSELGAAFVAMPGHKGLYGPQGTGVLLCGEKTCPLLEGGTGSQSREQEMPDFLPDRLEAGTHNMPGIAGLLEGVRFVRATGTENILDHERKLIGLLADGLRELPNVHLYTGENLNHQAGVLSFAARGWDVEDLGEALAQAGVAVRAGLHCAPLAHRTAGTFETGTVRLSVSAFNTKEEIAEFLVILRKIMNRNS